MTRRHRGFRPFTTLAIVAATLAVAGCVSLPTPRYTAALNNTLALREAGLSSVNVGEIRKDPAARRNVEKLKARGSPLVPPDGSFTGYLRDALTIEFEHADLLDADSTTRIEGLLQENAMGGSQGHEHFDLAARLVVRRDGAVVYDDTRKVRYEWDAAFFGGVAVPRAATNYRTAVQRLITAFVEDPKFLAALRAP